LQTLKVDLGIDNTYPWTIMTDKQKGLIHAVKQVFLEAEHRFCVRHLYQNNLATTLLAAHPLHLLAREVEEMSGTRV